MRTLRIFAALSLVVALAGGAGAQERAGGSVRELGSRPIDVTADSLSADSMRNTVTFEGTVVARQADVTLYADRIQADYSREAGAIDQIEAEFEEAARPSPYYDTLEPNPQPTVVRRESVAEVIAAHGGEFGFNRHDLCVEFRQ